MLASYSIFKLLQSISKRLNKLNKISRKISKLEPDINYINGIADLMPMTDGIETYKAMIDVTGDDLMNTYKTIEKELDE